MVHVDSTAIQLTISPLYFIAKGNSYQAALAAKWVHNCKHLKKCIPKQFTNYQKALTRTINFLFRLHIGTPRLLYALCYKEVAIRG
jgi:hypothetical protein